MGKVLLGNDNRCNRSNKVKKDTMAATSCVKGTSCCSTIDQKFISSGSSGGPGGSKYWDFNCPYGLPVWPPRNYTCSFCRRKFKSAQALGGHMNVHRRDRARLRSSELKPSSPLPPSSSALFSWKLVNDNATSPNISSSSHIQVNSNKRNPSNPSPDQTNDNLTSGGSMSIYSHQYSLVSLSLSYFSSSCPSTTLSSSTGSHNSHDGHLQPSSYECFKGFSGAEEFNFRPIYSLDDGIEEKEGYHEEKAIAGIDLKLGFIEGATDELDLELRL